MNTNVILNSNRLCYIFSILLFLTQFCIVNLEYEECTYSHFEQSCKCPICAKTLNENDFTELVVADATGGIKDIAKTSLQALFSKHSQSSQNDSKALPLSDLCFSLVRQIDVVKQSTKFLLKQLLMDSSSQARKVQSVLRSNEALKHEITNIKQRQSSQRLQYEQANNDLANRLSARESAITELNRKLAEKEQMLDQFRRLHGDSSMSSINGQSGRIPIVSAGRDNNHQIPPSSGGTGTNRHRMPIGSNSEPPLKGLMMQRQAAHAAQQQNLSQRRGPNMNHSGQGMINSSHSTISGGPMSRPFSTNSSGSASLSSASRVQDLSHNTGYSFTGASTNAQRLNKRRRSDTPANSQGMSPSTSFALNQGPHSVTGGRRWMQSESGYSQR